MKMVVGLGNPGKDYLGTRHNIGFEVVAELVSRFRGGRPKSKFKAEVVEIEIGSQKVVLVLPLTYMNLSGHSVRMAVDFYKLALNDLMLICDDLSLDVGRLRIRGAGSAGGQKGLANIIEQLGTDSFPRLRIGIGQPSGRMSAADFVLRTFDKSEKIEVEIAVKRAADAVELWVAQGIAAAMNKFNADPNAVPNKKRSSKIKEQLLDSDSGEERSDL
jgi:PTH1 family peptidyl-tRNA hydrolase